MLWLDWSDVVIVDGDAAFNDLLIELFDVISLYKLLKCDVTLWLLLDWSSFGLSLCIVAIWTGVDEEAGGGGGGGGGGGSGPSNDVPIDACGGGGDEIIKALLTSVVLMHCFDMSITSLVVMSSSHETFSLYLDNSCGSKRLKNPHLKKKSYF